MEGQPPPLSLVPDLGHFFFYLLDSLSSSSDSSDDDSESKWALDSPSDAEHSKARVMLHRAERKVITKLGEEQRNARKQFALEEEEERQAQAGESGQVAASSGVFLPIVE
jgi:hypothetical protein